jgi:hypothetical protein
MSSTFAVVFAAKLVGSVLAVADTGFPQFNPEPGCKAATAINQSIGLTVSQTFEACMADEARAKQELHQSWPKYSAADKTRCVGQTEDGGMPSYVEVLECILVTINVDNPSSAPPQ